METNYSESSLGASVPNGLNLTVNLQDGDSSLQAKRLLHTAAVLDYYYTPLLCLFGSMGNCLSVIVFCINANHRGLSSSYYLSALAISDTGFLINLFALWLDGMGVGVLSTQFGCTFIMFSGQVTCFVSVWLTVAFTIERFFAVCAPLSRPRVCTVSKAKKVICGLTGFALIAFSYVLVIARVKVIPNHDAFDHEKSHYNISTQVNQFINPQEETVARLSGVAESSFNAPVPSPYSDRDRMRTGSHQSYERPGAFGVEMDYTLSPESANAESTIDTARYADPSIGRINKSFLSLSGMINDSTLLYNEGVFTTKDEPVMMMCTVPPEYLTISTVANYLDSMITLIIPFCLIAFFNIRITMTVWKLKDERKTILAPSKFNRTTLENTQGCSASTNQVGRVIAQAAGNDMPQRSKRGGSESSEQDNGEIRESSRKKIWRSRMIPHLCECRSLFKSSPSPNSQESPINSEAHELQSLERNCDAEATQNKSCFHHTTEIKEGEGLHPGENISHVCPHCEKNNVCSEESGGRHGAAQSSDMIQAKPSNSYQSQEQSGTPQRAVVGYSSSSDLRNSAAAILTAPGRLNGRIPKRMTSVSSSASETRVTKMLLLVSTVFLVLNLPSHAIRAASFIQKLLWKDDFEGQQKLYAALSLSNILLFNTNFAVNFLLYCLSGRNFRKSLKNILLRKPKRMALNRISRKSKTQTVRNRSAFDSRKTDNETVIFDEITVGEPLSTHYHPTHPPTISPVERETRT